MHDYYNGNIRLVPICLGDHYEFGKAKVYMPEVLCVEDRTYVPYMYIKRGIDYQWFFVDKSHQDGYEQCETHIAESVSTIQKW